MKALLWGGPSHNKVYQVSGLTDLVVSFLPKRQVPLWASLDPTDTLTFRQVNYRPRKIVSNIRVDKHGVGYRLIGMVWVPHDKDSNRYDLNAIMRRLEKLGAVEVVSLDKTRLPVID